MAIQKGPIGSTIETAEIAAGAVTSAKLDTNIAISGNLTVDTDTLYVDSTNNRVGVGTSSPTATLDVNGTIKLDGNYPIATGNVALGNRALDALTTGNYNVGLGEDALIDNTEGFGNTAVGRLALGDNTTANSNTAVGYLSLYTNTTGAQNTAIGRDSLRSNTTASNSTAVGYQSLYSNTAGYNTAVGHQSLQDNTTGTPNTAVGAFALGNNTTAASNTAVGYAALFDNTTGASNTAVGTSALENNTTASNNTAVGYQALYTNTTATDNTAVGYEAARVVTTGSSNTIIGRRAAHTLTTGTLNAFLGQNSGNAITTGSKNTILGSFTGNAGGLDIRTSNNQIVISDGDGNWRARWTDAGHMLVGGAGGQINNYLAVDHATGSSNGSSFYACYYNGAQIGHISQSSTSSVAYNTTSDYRLKTDVQSLTGATDRLKQLNPVNFEWISDGTRSDGFIAHEVQTVVPEAISGEKDAIDENGNPVYQGIDQSKLIPLLVATIQELEARIAVLETN